MSASSPPAAVSEPRPKIGLGKLAEYSTPTGGAKNEDQIRMYRPNLYKSFLLTRLLVGIVGVLLPVVLVIADVATGRPVRGSLSAYHYHPSWLHVWFSGSLWAVGVGLMVYMGTRKSSVAGLVSTLAGVAALVVSLFPTNDQGQPLTWVSKVHFGAAAFVLIGLGVLCWGFGLYDRNRAGESKTVKRARELYWVHQAAAVIIALSIVFAAANGIWDFWPSHGLLVAEAVAILAFGASWTAKGWELWTYGRDVYVSTKDGDNRMKEDPSGSPGYASRLQISGQSAGDATNADRLLSGDER